MLEVKEARELILSRIEDIGSERLPLLETPGRVAAEDVFANRQQPPWDNSAMDGFALRAADIESASQEKPARLEVIEDIMAGDVGKRAVGPGQASRIMTGAPIPAGADAVVRVEWTRSPERNLVDVFRVAPVGNDIRRTGEDQRVGDLLIKKGTLVRPAEVGVLASSPRTYLRVYRQPVVAVIATGDELVEPDETPQPGQIVNTNAYSIAAMVREAGGRPLVLPIARDSEEALIEVFQEARKADILLTVGGVSVGEHDFVREVLEKLHVEVKFWKVRMTPGKPLAFGKWGHTPIFGLPGNPVSSMVSFELFVRPSLLKMRGCSRIFRRMLRAKLETSMKKRPGFTHFLRVRLREEKGRWIATSTGAQGSGILRSMSAADGLAIGEADLDHLEAGSEIWVMPLDDQWGMSERIGG